MGKKNKKNGMAAEHETRKGRKGGLKALADLKLPEPEAQVVEVEAKVEAKSHVKAAEVSKEMVMFTGGGVVDPDQFQAGRMLVNEAAAKKVAAILEGKPIPGVVILMRGEGKTAEYQLRIDREAYKVTANVKALREFKAQLAKDGLADTTPRG